MDKTRTVLDGKGNLCPALDSQPVDDYDDVHFTQRCGGTYQPHYMNSRWFIKRQDQSRVGSFRSSCVRMPAMCLMIFLLEKWMCATYNGKGIVRKTINILSGDRLAACGHGHYRFQICYRLYKTSEKWSWLTDRQTDNNAFTFCWDKLICE